MFIFREFIPSSQKGGKDNVYTSYEVKKIIGGFHL